MTSLGLSTRKVRVMVVDDSTSSRLAVESILGSRPGLSVVGSASDGEEALAKALRLKPDLIVLDLQMPRIDGFTFLRLLMAQCPTPVVVLSSLSRRNQVFKALELGALDFLPKPDGDLSLEAIGESLVEKCEALGHVDARKLGGTFPQARAMARPKDTLEPSRVVLVGASTGGPQALRRLLGELNGSSALSILVAQHMPERFTASFAERLAGSTAFHVKEAEEGDVVAVGRVLIAPGGHHLLVIRDERGVLRVTLEEGPGGRPSYCPSVDKLFISAARLLKDRACAVVLTGMGHDGQEGIREVKTAGGLTLAESESSAVVYGMPLAAVETGAVDEVLALGDLPSRLERFSRGT